MFFVDQLFRKYFQKYSRKVKQFGFRPGPTFCQARSGSKLFAKLLADDTSRERVKFSICLCDRSMSFIRKSRIFFQSGSNFDNVFFVDKGWEDPNTTISGPSSARPPNAILSGVSLAC